MTNLYNDLNISYYALNSTYDDLYANYTDIVNQLDNMTLNWSNINDSYNDLLSEQEDIDALQDEIDRLQTNNDELVDKNNNFTFLNTDLQEQLDDVIPWAVVLIGGIAIGFGAIMAFQQYWKGKPIIFQYAERLILRKREKPHITKEKVEELSKDTSKADDIKTKEPKSSIKDGVPVELKKDKNTWM